MSLDLMLKFILIPFIISYAFRVAPVFINLKIERHAGFMRFVEYFSYITIGNIIYANAFGEVNIFTNAARLDVLKVVFIFLSFFICSKIKNITYNFLICVSLFLVAVCLLS